MDAEKPPPPLSIIEVNLYTLNSGKKTHLFKSQ